MKREMRNCYNENRHCCYHWDFHLLGVVEADVLGFFLGSQVISTGMACSCIHKVIFVQ